MFPSADEEGWHAKRPVSECFPSSDEEGWHAKRDGVVVQSVTGWWREA